MAARVQAAVRRALQPVPSLPALLSRCPRTPSSARLLQRHQARQLCPRERSRRRAGAAHRLWDGDALRCGAIAANSPVISQLHAHAARGGYILGVCNGFQVLCETGLLPGALIRNASLNFVCKPQALKIDSANSAFTSAYAGQDEIIIPVAHHDGNYVADEDVLDRIESEGRVAFRYAGNPNGSARDIAGVIS